MQCSSPEVVAASAVFCLEKFDSLVDTTIGSALLLETALAEQAFVECWKESEADFSTPYEQAKLEFIEQLKKDQDIRQDYKHFILQVYKQFLWSLRVPLDLVEQAEANGPDLLQ